MHVKKKVCENLIKFILGLKDTMKVRSDMEMCGVWKHLWLKRDPQRPRKIFKPAIACVLKLKEVKTFKSKLASLKGPTNYCGVLGKHIMEKKLSSMKNHDWRVLMQQFMLLILRGLMDGHVRLSLMQLNQVFRNICKKVWDHVDLPTSRKDVATTLSLIEWDCLGIFWCDDTLNSSCGSRVGHLWASA